MIYFTTLRRCFGTMNVSDHLLNDTWWYTSPKTVFTVFTVSPGRPLGLKSMRFYPAVLTAPFVSKLKVVESAKCDQIIKKGCVSRDLSLIWRYCIFYTNFGWWNDIIERCRITYLYIHTTWGNLQSTRRLVSGMSFRKETRVSELKVSEPPGKLSSLVNP